MNFLIKLVRNAGILAGLMFVSNWANGTLTWKLIKPVVIFFIGYVLTELSVKYKLPNNKAKTLVF